MSKIHELAFDAEEIDELLDSVDKKTIYQDATQSEHGLMSTTDKTKLDALPTAQQIEGSLSEKVDKEEGKGLSENDYTDAEKESVASAYHKPQNGIPKTDLDSSVQTSLNKADMVVEVDEVTAAALNYLNERINGIVEALTRGLPSLRVEELTIARTLNAYIAGGNFYLNGEGAPTILPQFNGQEYFDETNKVWYKASFTGTEPTAAAWKLITNA